jgi:serine/threonine-protein kinase HipA
MNRCPITLEPCGAHQYSEKGLQLLSPRLTKLRDFPYSRTEQLEQAAAHASKLSIQGVQAKLSVRLNAGQSVFEIVDTRGTFIVKPPHPIFPEIVENEDVTMRLARASGISLPLSGMIYAKDKSLSYFIKRFDRIGHDKRLATEDFAQLSGHARDTKYDSSMEQVAAVIEKFCTFPAIEKVRLFRLTIFSFLVGNEDMHLKNFSLISRDGKVELSPAYDLLNTTIVLKTKEELALPLMGRKSGLKRQHLLDYFSIKRLGLPERLANRELDSFAGLQATWQDLIGNSFLSSPMQAKYLDLMRMRSKTLFG